MKTRAMRGDGQLDHQQLAKHVFDAIGPHLPPPGYVDIVFEDA